MAMRIVPIGTHVLSSCGRVVGVVYQVSTAPACPNCGDTRVSVRWPDGKRRDYCALGLLRADELGHDSDGALLMRGYRIDTREA